MTILVVELEEKTKVKVGELVVVEVVMKVEVAGVAMVVVEVRGGADSCGNGGDSDRDSRDSK